MYIGAHESVVGGLHQALLRGEVDQCEALQLFTSPSARWEPQAIDEIDASKFRSIAAAWPIPLMSHASYLINLASPDQALWRRSVDALVDELDRCELLGVHHVVLHPGSHMGGGAAVGIRRVGEALSAVCSETAGFSIRILLENTAGSGRHLGARFSELAAILVQAGHGDRLGVCVDTCHAFAAGYDLRSRRGYEGLLSELDETVGLSRVRAFHLNDARCELGERKDRHARIGKGTLGTDVFRWLLAEPRFAKLPGITELPPDGPGEPYFAQNVRALQALRSGVRPRE